MRRLGFLALLAAMSLAPFAASATIVHYDYVYRQSLQTVDIDEMPSEVFGSVPPSIGLGFDGPADLSGQTMTLDAFTITAFMPELWGVAGWVTFGAGNEITDWYLHASGGPSYAFEWEQMSDPQAIDVSPYASWGIDVEEGLNGMLHYGQQYAEPSSIWYHLEPGSWSMDTQVLSMPIPASALLLGSALFGVAMLRRR